MEFFSEIIQTLENNGIRYSILNYGSVLTASKCHNNRPADSKDTFSENPVTIIALPIGAESVHLAELQNKAVCKILENGPAFIITEDRWRNSRNSMKARLLAHLGIFRSIYARDCDVKKINRSEADSFLERNHSYGSAKCKSCYGIFLKRVRPKDYPDSTYFAPLQGGTLIAAAEFSNARRWNKGGKIIRSYEWIRYASLPEIRICGGMGKILKKFIEDVRPDDIMSYADLEWSDGEAYRQLGFIREGYKAPVTFIIDTVQWTRTPLLRHPDSPYLENSSENRTGLRFYQNPGSIKYRLKLTEYCD